MSIRRQQIVRGPYGLALRFACELFEQRQIVLRLVDRVVAIGGSGPTDARAANLFGASSQIVEAGQAAFRGPDHLETVK